MVIGFTNENLLDIWRHLLYTPFSRWPWLATLTVSWSDRFEESLKSKLMEVSLSCVQIMQYGKHQPISFNGQFEGWTYEDFPHPSII